MSARPPARSDREPGRPADSAGADGEASPSAGARRVASFLASGTEIVVALGAQDRLVAISHECDWPPDVLDRPRLSRPRFDPQGLDSGQIDQAVRSAMAEHGSVYAVDEDKLVELAPDLVLTQAVCEVCAVPTPGVRDTVRNRGLDAEVLSLDAHTVLDIQESIIDVGAALGMKERALAIVAEQRARIAAIAAAVKDRPRPRVLAIEWLDPPFAPGHWLPEMITLAGGENLAGTVGGHSEQMTWQQLEGLDPDVLIIMPCGYDLQRSLQDADEHADALRRIAPRAIDAGRAFAVDGSAYFNRSGPRYLTGIEILAGLLHPSVSDDPPQGTAAVWRNG